MSDAQQSAPAPAPADPRIYVVDRIERDVVVLVADAEPEAASGDPTQAASGDPSDSGHDSRATGQEEAEVPVGELPVSVAEGDVLRIPVWPDGTLVWGAAVLDPSERAERLREAEERLARLRKRDPGGDIVL